LRKLRVLARIDPIDAASEHRDRGAAGRKRRRMRDRIDAARES
jgi:hypothetical protein